MNQETKASRAGRPRAIPEALVPEVLSLYRQGLGYRAITRELRQRGISVDWSAVRRAVEARSNLEREEVRRLHDF